MQTKWMSFIETLVNLIIGFLISMVITILVFPHYGLNPSISANFQLTAIFTLASLIRGYFLRRLFVKLYSVL